MTDNNRAVLSYLQAHNGQNLTAADVADAIGLTKAQVNGVFTRCIQLKKLGSRVETEDGTKYLVLNDAGMAAPLED